MKSPVRSAFRRCLQVPVASSSTTFCQISRGGLAEWMNSLWHKLLTASGSAAVYHQRHHSHLRECLGPFPRDHRKPSFSARQLWMGLRRHRIWKTRRSTRSFFRIAYSEDGALRRLSLRLSRYSAWRSCRGMMQQPNAAMHFFDLHTQ